MGAIEITVNSTEEFQELVDNKDFRISQAVVEGILSNVNSKKKYVHVLSITEELYEKCAEITKVIESLKIIK